jgi:hypothetical protein
MARPASTGVSGPFGPALLIVLSIAHHLRSRLTYA